MTGHDKMSYNDNARNIVIIIQRKELRSLKDSKPMEKKSLLYIMQITFGKSQH